MKLLVVEDDHIYQSVVKKELESAGNEVLVCDNGLEALEKQIELCTPDWREEKPGSIKLVQPGTRFS